MDSVTQAVLGAAIGEVGFRHRLGKRALAFGALCGTLPDLDVVAGLAGEFASMRLHRGPTHSLLLIPLAAPVVGWIGHRLFGRSKDAGWHVWWHLAFWALFTHPLLDVFTSYGTQLLHPVSDRRFALDGMSIVDPIYTVPLLICVLLGLLTKSGPRLRVATAITLAFSTAYCLVGWGWSSGVVERARVALADQGVNVPDDVRALPMLGTNLAFRTVARTPDAIYVGSARAMGAGDPIRFTRFERGRSPAVVDVLATEDGQTFAWFSDGFWAAAVEPSDRGQRVTMSDLRYGSNVEPGQSFWGMLARVGADGRVLELSRWRGQGDLDFGAELAAIYRLVRSGSI